MHIRRKSISWIELRFSDGSGWAIQPLDQIMRLEENGCKLIGFIWHNPKALSLSPYLISWLQTEFRPLFTHDPIMWTASVSTAPTVLQPILLGLQ